LLITELQTRGTGLHKCLHHHGFELPRGPKRPQRMRWGREVRRREFNQREKGQRMRWVRRGEGPFRAMSVRTQEQRIVRKESSVSSVGYERREGGRRRSSAE